MKLVVGIPSFNRPEALSLVVKALSRSKAKIDGLILVADATTHAVVERYKEVAEAAASVFNTFSDVNLGRRGSTNARNIVLERFIQNFDERSVLITYDDDYIPPLSDWRVPVLRWIASRSVGIVGGRVINLRRRRVDPDFFLDLLPGLADVLTRLTGFVFLDSKHGPRFAEYVTHLMAIKRDVIEEGVRYDPRYEGTGYREESDLQRQVKRMGYKIVVEPRFYVYHLALEHGGDRMPDAEARFYWKGRNNALFIRKHGESIAKLSASTFILSCYSLFYGYRTFRALMRGLSDGLLTHARANT
ncbi:MAG: glycosyltransferase [Candidatus Nezhaarchaeota archaeon]|nr:glycosyltransferase [Candidatus Nezhaarchaeota archaeon]